VNRRAVDKHLLAKDLSDDHLQFFISVPQKDGEDDDRQNSDYCKSNCDSWKDTHSHKIVHQQTDICSVAHADCNYSSAFCGSVKSRCPFHILLSHWPRVDGGERRPLASVYEMIRYVRFMYVCDRVRVWRSPTSYGVHARLFWGLHLCHGLPDRYI